MKSMLAGLSLALTLSLSSCEPAHADTTDSSTPPAASPDECITSAEKLANVKKANPNRNDWKYIIEATGPEAHDALARLTALAGQPINGAAVSVISAQDFNGGMVIIFDEKGCVLGNGLMPMSIIRQVFGAQG